MNRLWKCVVILAVGLGGCGDPPTGEVVRTFTWGPGQEVALSAGEIVEEQGRDVLRVDGVEEVPHAVSVLAIDNPNISRVEYALVGEYRYEGEPTGYLEMWSGFANDQRYFSTIALTGSGWQQYELPFLSQPGQFPERVELAVVVPAGASIYLGPLALEQGLTSSGQAWFGGAVGGWLGAVGGTVVGLFGALIGILVSRGRGRRVMVGLVIGQVLAGTVFLVAGTIALARAQPFGVVYPLLLMGLLCTGAGLAEYFVLRRRFEAIELRKMQAMDAGMGDV